MTATFLAVWRRVRPLLGSAASWRGGWPALATLMLISLALRMPPGGPVAPASGDVPAYLAGAIHLRSDLVYAMSLRPGPPRPELAREPAYPVLLATLAALDPGFGQVTLDCVKSNDACPASMFQVPRLAILALILTTGLILFLVGRALTGQAAGGLIAAAYILFNAHANKGWGDLMSDRLAVCLVALCLLAASLAWRTRNP